ncbi:M48 family metallopeptidase [Curvivirga aplysinae]|uniref:M48 family metallopeptidase n=1 Tax=Curvivirga aplysinae TaxID=2529852 RepID=UPI0012BB9397|nr:M48 family metallopeptidase [Curvivirga aplysinae]MTI08594.1 M48 family metallopeptidase [Curvivirga aplysinae]
MSKIQFQDGKSALSREVLIHFTGTSVEILDKDTREHLASWQYDEIKLFQSNKHAAASRYVLSYENNTKAKLILDNNPETWQKVSEICPNLHKRPTKAPGWWKPIAKWGISAIIAIIIIIKVLIPMGARIIVSYIPLETEKTLGQELEKSILADLDGEEKYKVCTSLDENVELQLILAKLDVSKEERKDLSIKITSHSIPNAIALPGKHILIFDGLLKKTDHPNALAAVIAHELAHVKHRDGMILTLENVALAAVISLLIGDVSGGSALAIIAQYSMGASHSRDAEKIADQYAIKLMQKANLDVKPLADLLTKISSKENLIPDWLSTHPITKERANEIISQNTGTETILSEDQWHNLISICD